jgi:hypothetical protein
MKTIKVRWRWYDPVTSQHGCDYGIMGGRNGNTGVLATKSTVVDTTGERVRDPVTFPHHLLYPSCILVWHTQLPLLCSPQVIFDFLFLALLAIVRSLVDSLMCFLNVSNLGFLRLPFHPWMLLLCWSWISAFPVVVYSSNKLEA